MTNYPCEPSLELISGLVSKLYYLLQIMLFYSILQQTDNFCEKETHLNLLLMTNYPCVPSLQLINALVSKLYHLLQIKLFCSILQQPDNSFENETRLNLLLITNYPRVPSLELINALVSKLYHLLQIIILQHFAATWSFLEDETHWNQLRIPNYSGILNLVAIKQDHHGF